MVIDVCHTSGRRHGGMLLPPPVISCPALGMPQEVFPASPPGPLPPSPSSAIRLAYSESNPPLLIDGDGLLIGGAFGSLLTVQSRAMCPALPQTRQMMLAVKFFCSGQSYLRWPTPPQFWQIWFSSSRKVPLRAASSRSWLRLWSF